MPDELLSHPHKPLRQHLAEVEQAGMAILDRHPSSPFDVLNLDVRRILHDLAGWHDIAKATSFFQEYIQAPDRWQEKVSHNRAKNEQKAHTPLGALFAADSFSGDDNHYPWFHSLLMSFVIRGHHSRLPSIEAFASSVKNGFDLLNLQANELSRHVIDVHPALKDSLTCMSKDGFEAVYNHVCDLIDENWKEHIDASSVEELVRIRLAIQFCFSCLLEADKALLIHSSMAEYFGVSTREYPRTLVEDQLPPGDPATVINQQRRDAYNAVVADANSDTKDRRPRVLTLPTGLGKTRCAAGWAMHWRAKLERETGIRPKLIVVLPFLSVIEQTAGVYRDLLNLKEHTNDVHLQTSHSLSLRDHMDVETESTDGEKDADAQSRAEFVLDTWRSEIVLTTFDQFLLALMDAKSRHQQRFHNLCDALIVIDEVQAFPVHLWHPVGTLLKELANAGRSRLLLMTATQPGIIAADQRVDIIENPTAYAQPRYQIEIDPREMTLSQWLPQLVQEIRSNCDIRKWLIVVNTRRCAQTVYCYLRDTRVLTHPLLLLSSDIVPRDRLDRVRQIKECSSCIAVTTQCVEAGVDIDMDFVVRDFAPLDSLVQVAGRCNRNGKRDRQTVRVVRLLNEREDGTDDRAFCEYVYRDAKNNSIIQLQITRELLQNTAVVNEESVTELVEEYFRRLGNAKDKGSEITKNWATFGHDELNIQRELRGDNSRQVTFVVTKLDPRLSEDLEAAYAEPDRWARRRKLRDLGPRIAQVSVSVWVTHRFRPEQIGEPFPSLEYPSFWFLDDRFYDEAELGLITHDFDGSSTGTEVL